MTRARTAIIAASLALPLVLGACGGGSDRAELIDAAKSALTEAGLPAEAQECVMEFINTLSDDELKALDTEEPPQELQTKVISAMTDCVTSTG